MLIGKQSKTATADKDTWATPVEIVRGIKKYLNFPRWDLDAAANKDNAKASKFITKEQDTLQNEWGTNRYIWLNPPYSNPAPFIEKALKERENGNRTALLLPADTSTKWFDLLTEKANLITFITKGRIGFIHNSEKQAKRANSKGSIIVEIAPNPNPEGAWVEFVTLEKLLKLGESEK